MKKLEKSSFFETDFKKARKYYSEGAKLGDKTCQDALKKLDDMKL
jgi:TPR repeat protein